MIKKIEDSVFPKNKIEIKIKLKKLFVKKYKKRSLSINKNRKKENIIKLKRLIRDMIDDGFNQTEISKLIGRDVSTINNHLKGRKR